MKNTIGSFSSHLVMRLRYLISKGVERTKVACVGYQTISCIKEDTDRCFTKNTDLFFIRASLTTIDQETLSAFNVEESCSFVSY